MKNRKIPVYFPDGPRSLPGYEYICTDPYGSYTGLVQSPDEKPVQDADDL